MRSHLAAGARGSPVRTATPAVYAYAYAYALVRRTMRSHLAAGARGSPVRTATLAGLRLRLRSRASHDAFAPHRRRLRLAGSGGNPAGLRLCPCRDIAELVAAGNCGGRRSIPDARDNYRHSCPSVRGRWREPEGGSRVWGGLVPKVHLGRRTEIGRFGSTSPREARRPKGRRSVEGPPARPAPKGPFHHPPKVSWCGPRAGGRERRRLHSRALHDALAAHRSAPPARHPQRRPCGSAPPTALSCPARRARGSPLSSSGAPPSAATLRVSAAGYALVPCNPLPIYSGLRTSPDRRCSRRKTRCQPMAERWLASGFSTTQGDTIPPLRSGPPGFARQSPHPFMGRLSLPIVSRTRRLSRPSPCGVGCAEP